MERQGYVKVKGPSWIKKNLNMHEKPIFAEVRIKDTCRNGEVVTQNDIFKMGATTAIFNL